MWTQRDTRHTLRKRITGLTLGSPSALVFRIVEHSTNDRTASAVRAELARRKISGRHLAEGLGWSVSATWRRLNGTTPFRVDQLDAVAAHLGVPVSTFLADRERAA